MTVFIPSECHNEYEKIKCKNIRVHKKTCFIFTETLSYGGVSYVMIRRYDKIDPKITADVYFLDGRQSSVWDILIMDVS